MPTRMSRAGSPVFLWVIAIAMRALRQRCIAFGAFAISSRELVDCLTL